jgi:indole-3-glycerol phosphate synthase
MPNILDEIIRAKRAEVARRSSETPLDVLKRRISSAPAPRNFFNAVTRQRDDRLMTVIAEVKKASPSAGVIRENFDPVEIARSYELAGADALSVLTDEPYFQGKLEYLALIRERVGLPLLRKDFIIDPWQVYESRAAGADAILLIAECLRTDELIDLQILATELNLTCLIEVHDMENLMRVRDQVIGFPHRSYSLIGINNRDLRTFQTDVGTTLRLAELVADRDVLVTESGLRTREDVVKLHEAGVRAALVGETLMRSGNVAGTLHELFSTSVS